MKLSKKVVNKLKELNISLVYLFGSYVNKKMNFQSDIDIAILFYDDSYKKYKLKIYSELYKIFSDIFKNREVDIVFLNESPLTLKFEVVTSGKPIYFEKIDTHYEYKERVIKEYIDFKPLLDEQDKEILNRIWKKIHRLIHFYSEIDSQEIYEIITKELDDFKEFIKYIKPLLINSN